MATWEERKAALLERSEKRGPEARKHAFDEMRSRIHIAEAEAKAAGVLSAREKNAHFNQIMANLGFRPVPGVVHSGAHSSHADQFRPGTSPSQPLSTTEIQPA